ncbi:MAG: zinc ribbon domain-containing protein [Candidatus Heimdallarchaeaceae archaeon]
MTKMHGVPEGKRRVFNKENFLQQFFLGGIIILSFVWAFFFSKNMLLKVLSAVGVAIVGTVVISYYLIEFLTGKGYSIASALNELFYLVIGIPLLVISAGFLPASILVAFFYSQETIKWFIPTIYSLVGVLEILSIIYILRRYLKDKNMNLFQYLKYIFDFERRAQERREFEERTQQIDDFYSGLHKVESRIAKKMEEKSTGFEEFDWKEKVNMLSPKLKKEVECWNCHRKVDEDSTHCSYCGAILKREE